MQKQREIGKQVRLHETIRDNVTQIHACLLILIPWFINRLETNQRLFYQLRVNDVADGIVITISLLYWGSMDCV